MKNEYKKIKKILIVIIGLNLVSSFINLISGLSDNPYNIFSFSNSFNSIPIIILVALQFGADNLSDEKYSPRRYESIITLFVSFTLLIMAFQLFTNIPNNIGKVNISDINLIGLISTTIINIGIVKYEVDKGKQLKSKVLTSDAMHTLSFVFISIATLAAFIITKYLNAPVAFYYIFGIVAAIRIFKTAISILKESVTNLITKDKIEA